MEELLRSDELIGSSPLHKKMGRDGGTFVVKELVYAYAMWISASFQLKVIRAFDTLQTQGVIPTQEAPRVSTIRLCISINNQFIGGFTR